MEFCASCPQGKTAAAKSLVILEREPRPTLARQAGAVDEAGALLASPLKLMRTPPENCLVDPAPEYLACFGNSEGHFILKPPDGFLTRELS